MTRQLAGQSSKTPDSIVKAFNERERKRPRPEELLQSAVGHFKRVYIIVDALDRRENESIRDLMSAIRSLADNVLPSNYWQRPGAFRRFKSTSKIQRVNGWKGILFSHSHTVRAEIMDVLSPSYNN